MKEVTQNLITGTSRTTLLRSLQKAARTIEGKLHIIPFGERWGIKMEGKNKFHKQFHTKAAAIRNAKAMAASSDISLLVIHGRDGRITSSVTFPQ